MHVNEIIRQTSSDRTYIITTIRLLERGQLITRNKRVRRGNKVMMQLTEVGRELVDILRGLKQWKDAYLELQKAYVEKIEDKDDDVAYPVIHVMYTSETNIVDTMVCRSLQLHEFQLGEIAKSILYDMIKDAASFQLSIILEGSSIGSNIPEDVLDNIYESQYDYSEMIYKEVKDALISQISLLKPPRKTIEKYVKQIKGKNNKGFSVHPRFKCLLETYEEYLRGSLS